MKHTLHCLAILLTVITTSPGSVFAQPASAEQGLRRQSIPHHDFGRESPAALRMQYRDGQKQTGPASGGLPESMADQMLNESLPRSGRFRQSSPPMSGRSRSFPLSLPAPATESVCETEGVAWTANYASGLISSNDLSWAIATDASGNIYTTGVSNGDYLTVKYDQWGVQQWVARYDGPAKSDDEAWAIAVDSLGNVYVTGWSTGVLNDFGFRYNYDYATVKYSASGMQQWVARYNGPGDSIDYAVGLALDDSGNVVVTGYSIGSESTYDYATIRYSASGEEQWVARYHDPAGANLYAVAVGLDASGNIVVAGESFGMSEDYVTVKYNARGIWQWVARYDGPANSTDQLSAMAVRPSGTVLVTGRSLGSSFDYATVEYDVSGVQQWVARYGGPGGIADNDPTALCVDASGNSYVTGLSYQSGTSYDYVTVKYDTLGAERWVVRYDDPYSSYDAATAIRADASGGVYVTGWSYGAGAAYDFATVKYDTSGTEQWVARYNSPGDSQDEPAAMVIDGSGNLCVTGWSYLSGALADYLTVKYSASGAQEWVSRYTGVNLSGDFARALTVDRAGNAYMTGQSLTLATQFDYATVKVNAMGVTQWIARYNGPANADDIAQAIVVDDSGNVYVTGQSAGTGAQDDYATVKYDASGVERWVARYDGPEHSVDQATALTVDASGNVYVAGTSMTGAATSFDFATVKYDASGSEQWVARYDGPANLYDAPVAIAVDVSGSVFVTGESAGSGNDYATVKYNPSGAQQWAARYNGPAGLWDKPTGLALDQFGNVYVTGYSIGLGMNYDYATVKYDASGTEQWVARYDGPGHSDDYAAALALDSSGNVYVTGGSAGATRDFVTLKYSASGLEQWVARYDGPTNGNDNATAIALDISGNIYVTGLSGNLDGTSDYATVRYDSMGVETWAGRRSGTRRSSENVPVMALDASANIYVAGTSVYEYGYEYEAVKYQRERGYMYSPRWNLVSLPRVVSVPLPNIVFPSSGSRLFAYNGAYVESDSLEFGRGYWLKFPASSCLSIPGDTMSTDTVEVVGGWNLIGALSVAIPVSSISSDPPSMTTSRFFGYSGTYTRSDILEPGLGYWVKVAQDGKLLLSAPSGSLPASSKIRIVPTDELPPQAPDEAVSDRPNAAAPAEFALDQNYPNPFNPLTRIAYGLPRAEWASLKVFDVLGREVATLVHERQNAGRYEIEFDGSRLPSGMYFYRLQAGSFTEAKKLLLVR